MARKQSARLDQKKLWGDPVLMVTIILLILFLALFILYPLIMLLVDSVYDKSTGFTLSAFQRLFTENITGVPLQLQKAVLVSVIVGVIVMLVGLVGCLVRRAIDAKGTPKDKILRHAPKLAIGAPLWILLVFLFEEIYNTNTSGFLNALSNTVVIGVVTGVVATLIGLLFAYVDCYVKVRARLLDRLFKIVSVMPVVSPPFVLSLSMILLFGRTGLVTRSLFKFYDSNIYGMGSIIIVQTLTFFPVCYLMFKGLLKNIDPSMEEAARDMGASRLKVFFTVTLPLMLPGLGNSFLITFIESAADFANPKMIGGSCNTLATTIYLRITGGSYDTMGATAMAVMLLSLSIWLFVVQKFYLESKTAATLTGKASRERMLIDDRSVRVPLCVICIMVSIFVVLMYVSVPIGAMFNLWGRDYSLSLKWFKKVFDAYDGVKIFADSIRLSVIAAPLTAILSMIISYLVVKRRFRGRGFIEMVSILAMAVPGTVLGVGFIRGFANGVFRTGLLEGIYNTGWLLIIVLIVRSLPVGTRSGISALRQIDRSIEESAYDMGAGSGRVFLTVTLPLTKDSFFSGLVTAFVRSITAISAVILLVTPKYILITTTINELAERGEFAVACALATLLIVVVYSAILLMNGVMRIFGTSRKVRLVEVRPVKTRIFRERKFASGVMNFGGVVASLGGLYGIIAMIYNFTLYKENAKFLGTDKVEKIEQAHAALQNTWISLAIGLAFVAAGLVFVFLAREMRKRAAWGARLDDATGRGIPFGQETVTVVRQPLFKRILGLPKKLVEAVKATVSNLKALVKMPKGGLLALLGTLLGASIVATVLGIAVNGLRYLWNAEFIGQGDRGVIAQNGIAALKDWCVKGIGVIAGILLLLAVAVLFYQAAINRTRQNEVVSQGIDPSALASQGPNRHKEV